jgi:hypothetical protein
MKPIYPLLLLPILFLSCSPARISYIGAKSPSTQKVDVYVDEAAIPKNYIIIGKGYIEPDWRGKLNQEKMLIKAIEKAKRNGADAVFYKETFIPAPATMIQSVSRTDSIARGLQTNSSARISSSYGFFHNEVLFLKYQ